MKRPTVLIALFAVALLAGLTYAADKDAPKDSAKDADRSGKADQAAARTQQPKPDADGFYSLFDGKSLEGWKPDENPQTFKVQDGNVVVNGQRSHLFYVGPVHNHDFKNFHFKAEVMTFANSNSGIYFHTKPQGGGWPSQGFECQVNNTYTSDPKKTGGLYAVKDVMNVSPAGDNEWFTYDITVKGNHVELKIYGKTTTDWTQTTAWKH